MGINRFTIIIYKLDNQQGRAVLGNCTQHFVIITYKGKEKIDMYVCIRESLCCTLEIKATLNSTSHLKTHKAAGFVFHEPDRTWWVVFSKSDPTQEPFLLGDSMTSSAYRREVCPSDAEAGG